MRMGQVECACAIGRRFHSNSHTNSPKIIPMVRSHDEVHVFYPIHCIPSGSLFIVTGHLDRKDAYLCCRTSFVTH